MAQREDTCIPEGCLYYGKVYTFKVKFDDEGLRQSHALRPVFATFENVYTMSVPPGVRIRLPPYYFQGLCARSQLRVIVRHVQPLIISASFTGEAILMEYSGIDVLGL